MKRICLIVFFGLAFQQVMIADDLKLSLIFTNGEKSKDSWSSTTIINIDGNSADYSITYSGSIKKSKSDVSKKCILTDEQIRDIKQTVISYGLNKNDSLFDKSTKYKAFERFINLTINIELDGKPYIVRINGDVSLFKSEELYNNSLKFVDFINDLMDLCQ